MLEQILVKKDHARAGIGSQLLEECTSCCKIGALLALNEIAGSVNEGASRVGRGGCGGA